MQGEFSVYTFFPDGGYIAEARLVDAKTAIKIARQVIGSIGGRMGIVRRVIITDGGDLINFEWRFGEGDTFPTPASPHGNN